MRRRTDLGMLIRHPFVQAVLILLLALVIFRFGIRPAAPASVLVIYMGIVMVALVLFVSSNEKSWRSFQDPIWTLLVGRESWVTGLRWSVFILLPVLVGLQIFTQITRGAQAPAELRQVHPAPPSSIGFRGNTIELEGLDNPFWEVPAESPLPEVVLEGKEVYVTHCVFCHGDALQGFGLFARGLNPAPANFTDPATITQLQQSYLFWRIAKGGVGLPSESAPWNSAMPAWEDYLTEEQIWKVITYLYEAAGPDVNPRTWE